MRLTNGKGLALTTTLQYARFSPYKEGETVQFTTGETHTRMRDTPAQLQTKTPHHTEHHSLLRDLCRAPHENNAPSS